MSKARQKDMLDAFTGMLLGVSRRPTMYTRNGSFWEVVAYVEGYFQGASNPTGEYGFGKENGLGVFGRWLAHRFGHADSGSWALTLLEHCGDNEQQAVQQLWPLYEEYLRDKR
jgi:hypothetical protein